MDVGTAGAESSSVLDAEVQSTLDSLISSIKDGADVFKVCQLIKQLNSDELDRCGTSSALISPASRR